MGVSGNNSHYYNPYIETLPREKLVQLQERRLLELLPVAYERSGLIHKVWNEAGITPADIQTVQDYFDKAPFIDKDAIRAYRDEFNDPLGGLLIAEQADLELVEFTSGTTGDPTPVPRGCVSAAETRLVRDMWEVGMRPGDYVCYLMFTYRGGHNYAANWANIGSIPIILPHDPTLISTIIESIKTYRPTTIFLVSTPMLLAFESYFQSSGEDPKMVFSSVKGAVFGGEPLSSRLADLTESWGLTLFEMTAMGDIGAAVECKQHNGLHAWEDRAIVEILDDDGKAVADGEIGELVVTSLCDPIAPLIRYRTEDLVRVDRQACGCGRTHARLWVLGRKGDQTIVNDRVILPRELQEILVTHRETFSGLFQIIRPSMVMGTLHLRIGYNLDAMSCGEDELKARLRGAINTAINVPVDVELIDENELLKLGPPHKIPRVTKQ